MPYKTQFKMGNHFIISTSELLQNSHLRISVSNHCISNETTLYSIPPPNDEYFDNHFLFKHQTEIKFPTEIICTVSVVTYFTLYAVGYIVR